jgi:valyl-tRNA synthetase
MPFISEELYQRLPRRAPDTDAPSITVTQYPLPEHFSSFKNETIEVDFNVAKDAVLKIRSLRADYQLTNKVKTECKAKFKVNYFFFLILDLIF